MNCSYGNAYRLAPADSVRQALIQTADNLCGRFDSKIGCIRSWEDVYKRQQEINVYIPPMQMTSILVMMRSWKRKKIQMMKAVNAAPS